MRRVVIDAYEFVGLRGGSGGAGNYVLALAEHLARLVDVRVIASDGNSHILGPISDRIKGLSIYTASVPHADAIRTAIEEADILYAPFSSLPERSTYNHIPAVTAIHDLQHRSLKSFFPLPERSERDTVYFAAAAGADGVLTFSNHERQNIIQTYNIGKPVGVVAHAPFLAEEIERLGDLDVPPDRNPYVERFGRYILYPAVNWPHKNHYRLIEAFRLICLSYGVNDVKLVLTGASCVEPRFHFYRTLLDTAWSENRVIELGFVTNSQLFLLMKGAELLVFPSMYEGFGIPVLEALRLGTPVLASNLNAMREWFGGHFHPLADIRNSLSIADDLYQLIISPQRRNALRNAGLVHAATFSSCRMAEETLGFLSSVLDETHRAKRQRNRPHRDMRTLRSPTCQVLFHVVFDNADLSIASQVAEALETLGDALDGVETGAVSYLRRSDLAPAVPLPTPNGKHLKVIRAGHVNGNAELGGIDADGAGWREVVRRLTSRSNEVSYFQDNELPGVILFNSSTQFESQFHCFVNASHVATLAGDERFRRSCKAAVSQKIGATGGFYVGPSSWPIVRTAALQVLHNSPWSMAEAAQGNCLPASHDFLFTNAFVRRREFDYFGKRLVLDLTPNKTIKNLRARFVYIETELKERVGHHFELVKGLCQAADAGGLDPIIGANLGVSADTTGDIDAVPFFSSYSQAPDDQVTPSRFARELLSFLDAHGVGASDYVYLHMPVPTLIVGILEIVATSRSEDLPVFLIRICSLDESFRWHDIRQTRCVQSISRLGAERRSRIRIFVESIPLQRYFEQETGQRFPVLLNPVLQELALARLTHDALRREKTVDEPFVFGCFGEAREEKGFQLLPGIVERLIRRHGPRKVRFHVQTAASPINDTVAIKATRRKLQRLAETNKADGAVVLMGAFENTDAYFATLAKSDALLMPYDPAAYQIRGSGVALEGLVLGIPIVVTEDTDMAVTFEGPWCVCASDFSAEAFERACSVVIDGYLRIAEQSQQFIQKSPLVQTEAQYLDALLHTMPEIPATAPRERPVALWIGNDVVRQGCSAVYDAQRGFLERQGFEIYNVYVPYPDGAGLLESDGALEKRLVASSLGWAHGGFHFGCYSWILNQSDDLDRRDLLDEIAREGASTARLLLLNSFSTFPLGLTRLVENRNIALVCLNYVHLLPIVEKLGLVGRNGTRLVLESHDIQAYQHAIRADRQLEEDDKDLEIAKFADVDAVVAISLAEYSEIRELNPWVMLKFVLPTISVAPGEWIPDGSWLTAGWLDIWSGREDLQQIFDLRTPASLRDFRSWILAYGRVEYPACPLTAELVAAATGPHPDFPVGSGGTIVPFLIGLTWRNRNDLRCKWPNATNPDHRDRAALLRWAVSDGWKELALTPDGKVPIGGQPLPATQSSRILEAFLFARPSQLLETHYRLGLWRWLATTERINVIIVGSEHPANLIGIRRFIDDVFREYLEPEGVSLILVGRAGPALGLASGGRGLFVVGEVESLDSLYRLAEVVVVPTVVGTGTPIKILDALARGLCISMPGFVDRSLGLGAFGFPLNNSESDFAADILDLLKSPEARQKRASLAKRFAKTHLTIDAYDASWKELAGLSPAKPVGLPSATEPPIRAKTQKFPVPTRNKRARGADQEGLDAD